MSTTGFRGAPVSKVWALSVLLVPLVAAVAGLRGHPVLSTRAAFYPISPPPVGTYALVPCSSSPRSTDSLTSSVAFASSPTIRLSPLSLLASFLHTLPATILAYVNPASTASHLLVLSSLYALSREVERRLGSEKFCAFLARVLGLHAMLTAVLVVGSAWLVHMLHPGADHDLQSPYRADDGFGFDLWSAMKQDARSNPHSPWLKVLLKLSTAQIPGPIGLLVPLLVLLLHLSPGLWSIQITLPCQTSALHAEFKDLHIWGVVILMLGISDAGSMLSAGISLAVANVVTGPFAQSSTAPTSKRNRLSTGNWAWSGQSLSSSNGYQVLDNGQDTTESSIRKPASASRTVRQRTMAVGTILIRRIPLGHHVAGAIRALWHMVLRLVESSPPPRSSRAERRRARIIPMASQGQADPPDRTNNTQGGPSPRSPLARSLARLFNR